MDLVHLESLDDETWLVRRPTAACALRDDCDRLRVLLGDRVLDVPARLRPALEQVRSRPELRPVDLGTFLDASSRLVLCRRLVREGLLEVAR